jgi:hypothetical protein
VKNFNSLVFALVIVGVLSSAMGSTPAAAGEAAPISNVRHEPLAPKPNMTVLVTARLERGLSKPVLKVQAVAPGKYVRKSDAGYEKDWTDLPMRDDGNEGDIQPGDGIYSVRVPASHQRHRWLIRYRIVATDAADKLVQAPEAAAASPNYAWWCNGGPAAWTGSREPGKVPAVTYSAAFLDTLEAVHLLARAEDVAKSQWDRAAHKVKQEGTVVYRGMVYDHIQYRNSGQASAHAGGKNKWVIKFNRGKHLPFVDHDQISFPGKWEELRLNPGTHNPFIPVLRGITGLDEVMTMRAYRLAGVPSPPATWVQWRVIAGADEVSTDDQYTGDLWGPYVALGGMAPNLLADHKLPDGLTVTVQTQTGLKHVPKGMNEPKKLWDTFRKQMRSKPDEDWWRQNLDLPAYYSFHAMNRLLGNVDLRPDGNHGYYRDPNGRWAPIPWDTDMMFIPRSNQSGQIDAIRCLKHQAIALEYRNRAREILDLFASDAGTRGGQVGQLTMDLGAALTPKGHDVDWPRLDEARWNFHPKIPRKGLYFVNPARAQHGGGWTRTLETADFAGFQKYIVDFCTDSRPVKNYLPYDGDPRGHGWGFLAHEAKDDRIPATPTVKRQQAGGFRFEASAFTSAVAHQAAALEWRVGRVGRRGWYELDNYWRKELKGGGLMEVPAEVFKEPGVYRVRARWRDDTGRCGHWSTPVTVNVR